MTKFTYATIKNQIENELDLLEETFIDDSELLGYVNEAIDIAESYIHNLHEDYFLTNYPLPLVAGTTEYDLPTDIYANKIRIVMYDDSPTQQDSKNEAYEIKRIKKLSDLPWFNTNDAYQYILTNSTSGGQKIKFYPIPRDTQSNWVTIWYIRNAARLTGDTDYCDIPEFISYIIQYSKVKCLQKSNPNLLEYETGVLNALQTQMIDALKDMVDDDSTGLVPDTSIYSEMN